jgi:asparagine synthase (glutamine-hydrolysing)
VTALAGWIHVRDESEAAASCKKILEGQRAYFSSSRSIETDTCAAIGGASSLLTPADRPAGVLAANDRFIVAADCRIDNRDEVAAALKLGRGEVGALNDPSLILAGWSRWREQLIPKLDGDFAIAVYERANRRLTLARDAGGQRPLFFAVQAECLGFASMPIGLLAEPRLRRGWNLNGFASSLGDQLASELTYFEGIHRLMPGHLAVHENGRVTIGRWWNPSFEPLRMSDEQWVEAYRSELSRSVDSKIHDRGRVIASHLSAGWDSSAVTAAAAHLGPAVIAYTAAPDEGFKGVVPRGFMADESKLAAATAARLGIEHHVIRHAPLTLEYLERQAVDYQEPSRNLINAAWNAAVHRHARDRGATVLLNGQLGNLTLNFGGLGALPYWIRQGRITEWWRQASAAARRDDVSWGGLLFSSFQPWLPATLWRQLRRARMKIDRQTGYFLHPDLRDIVSSYKAEPPPSDPSLHRMALVGKLDHGMFTKGMIAEIGMEDIDPLADRRLMEFSLRLPPERMLDRGVYRPLARRALAGQVPPEVLDARLRGIQSADWQLRFTPAEANRMLEAIGGDPDVEGILDLARIRAAIVSWPENDRDILDKWELYSRMLPIALATGVFIKTYASPPAVVSPAG